MSDDSTLSGVRGSRSPPRRQARPGVTLEGFCTTSSQSSGLRLADLAPIEEFEVWTRNSCYRLTVLDPIKGRLLVQGGAFFPVTAEARLGGATLGGSMLKLGWIGCGFCMELHFDGQWIVTTPVREIRRVSHADSTATC